MIKYKNTSNATLMIEVNKKLCVIKPQQEISSSVPLFNKYLTEICTVPIVTPSIKKEIKKYGKPTIDYSGDNNDS